VRGASQASYRFCPECGKEFSASVSVDSLSQEKIENFNSQIQKLQQFSFQVKKLKGESPFRRVFRLNRWLGFLFVGFFIGLLIASAGLALVPQLSKVTASFNCSAGEFVIVSRQYSYKPGQSGVTRDFYCVDKSGARTNLLVSVLFYSFLIYGALISLLLSLGWLFYSKVLLPIFSSNVKRE